jgi:hypothetical protein
VARPTKLERELTEIRTSHAELVRWLQASAERQERHHRAVMRAMTTAIVQQSEMLKQQGEMLKQQGEMLKEIHTITARTLELTRDLHLRVADGSQTQH